MKEKIRQILRHEADALLRIPTEGPYEEAIDLLYQQIHQRKGKLVVSGMGKAGQIGHNIATTFSSTGTPAVFLHPSEAQHGDLGLLQQEDVLLLISNSGRTREILELIGLARQLMPEIKLLCITGQTNTPLADIADHTLLTGAPEEVCPLGLTPTTSTTSMTVVGDILVVLMMQKINFSREDYARRHHSGYLGDKARKHE